MSQINNDNVIRRVRLLVGVGLGGSRLKYPVNTAYNRGLMSFTYQDHTRPGFDGQLVLERSTGGKWRVVLITGRFVNYEKQIRDICSNTGIKEQNARVLALGAA